MSSRQEQVASLLARGDALAANGPTRDLRAAVDAYHEAFKLDLSHTPTLVRLGHSAKELGDFDVATKTFRALLLQKIEPSLGITKGDVFFALGEILVAQRDSAKARAMLERAISSDGTHARASALLAKL